MSPNTNTDGHIIANQLREKPTLTYPTIFKHRIVEMTAVQRYNLLKRINDGKY